MYLKQYHVSVLVGFVVHPSLPPALHTKLETDQSNSIKVRSSRSFENFLLISTRFWEGVSRPRSNERLRIGLPGMVIHCKKTIGAGIWAGHRLPESTVTWERPDQNTGWFLGYDAKFTRGSVGEVTSTWGLTGIPSNWWVLTSHIRFECRLCSSFNRDWVYRQPEGCEKMSLDSGQSRYVACNIIPEACRRMKHFGAIKSEAWSSSFRLWL